MCLLLLSQGPSTLHQAMQALNWSPWCRKTWESIPEKFRPLPGRLNVVLTSKAQSGQENPGWPKGVLAFPSLRSALQELAQPDHIDSVERVYVIGGAQAQSTLHDDAALQQQLAVGTSAAACSACYSIQHHGLASPPAWA